MNYQSFRQQEDERKDKLTFRNTLVSGLVAIALLACASKIKSNHEYNLHNQDYNSYTNHYQRVVGQ